MLGNVAPLFDADGKVRGCISVYLDITQRKEAESRLERVQMQLARELEGMRLLHELSARLMNQTDLTALLREILDAAQSIVGADKGHVQLLDEDGTLRIAAHRGFQHEFLAFFDGADAFTQACAGALTRHERVVVCDIEKSEAFAGTPALSIMRNAGLRAVQATPMISYGGTPIGFLSMYRRQPWAPSERDVRLLDLLAQEAAELIEKLRGEEALRRSEARLATILEHLPVGVAVTDGEGNVVATNPAWGHFRAAEPASGNGAGSAHLTSLTGNLGISGGEDPVARALGGEKVVPGVELMRPTAGEGDRWTRVSAVPLRDADQHVFGALVMIRDIDEERRAEEQRVELAAKERALASEKALRELEADLARVVRALSVGEMASSIAHEVNQPLAGVVINAEAGLRWLNNQPPGLDEARESLALIARDGHRASAMIRRIREFLRKDSRQTVSLDINEVIQESVALTQAELLKRGVLLEVDAPDGLPRIQGDRIQLEQVVINLLMNGAEAMIAVEGPKEMRLRTELSDEGRLTVSVRDRGTGVTQQHLKQMFEALFTTKTTGMGMGLSISRSIIEAHAGRIWAENNPDGPGLTVRFALPADVDIPATKTFAERND